jgi:hypothetical protein
LEEDTVNVWHLSTDECSNYNTIGNPQALILSLSLSRGRLDNELVGGSPVNGEASSRAASQLYPWLLKPPWGKASWTLAYSE